MVKTMYNQSMTSGEDIKELRKSLNLSQEDFAREIGVTLNTINRWENEHVHPNKLAVKAIEQVREKYFGKVNRGL
jgi:putative transcriptional regulator